jgi:hypothetical protein
MDNCSPFKWRHFEAEIILLCVRWYLRYSLSYRDLEGVVEERAGARDKQSRQHKPDRVHLQPVRSGSLSAARRGVARPSCFSVIFCNTTLIRKEREREETVIAPGGLLSSSLVRL